MIIIIISTVLE